MRQRVTTRSRLCRVLRVSAATFFVTSTVASAVPPGYVRLSQGSIVSVPGTRFICAVQQQTQNVASPIVGIICGLGSPAGATPGSYWISLRLPDDVLVTHATGSHSSTTAYAHPAGQRRAYLTAGGQPLTLPPPQLLDVYDLGIWCTVQVAKDLLPGQLSVACYFASNPSSAGRPGSYGFILSDKKVEVVHLNRTWQVVWTRPEPG